jgi:hypothetical protein
VPPANSRNCSARLAPAVDFQSAARTASLRLTLAARWRKIIYSPSVCCSHSATSGLMTTLDRPKLRPLSASCFDRWGQQYAYYHAPLGAFNGPVYPVDCQLQETVRQFDGERFDHAAAGDPARWFQTAATVSNRWGLCGRAATYIMFHAIAPATGRQRYHQAVDDGRTSCASFATMVFHASEDPLGPECSCTNDHTIC